MKQYMSYKSCRIRWIGQIPSEWKVSKVKYLALDNTSIFMDGDWINSDIMSTYSGLTTFHTICPSQ